MLASPVMRIRHLAPLAAGFVTAAALVSFPASASDQSIATQPDDTWNPNAVTIGVGETVTWSNAAAGFHNVCVDKPGSTSTSCDEFRNGDAGFSWSGPGYTNSHKFLAPGTYTFFCQIHGSPSAGMRGTIVVQDSSGTGTTTTPPPDTQPTDTTTVPTETTGQALDTTAPSLTGVKRRASRKSLIVELRSSEPAVLKATVYRRAPGGQSFSRVGDASLKVKQGKNVVTLPRKAAGSLRSGSYRIKLQLVDYARNSSTTKTLSFKLA